MDIKKAFVSVGHYPKSPGAMNTKYGLIEHHEARKIMDALFTEIISHQSIFSYNPVPSRTLLKREGRIYQRRSHEGIYRH